MGGIRTLQFRFDSNEGQKRVDAFSRAIAPGERALFGNSPYIPLSLESAVALAWDGERLRELPIRELHIGDPWWESEGAPYYRKMDVKDGVLDMQGGAPTQVNPEQKCGLVVENDLTVAVRPKVVVVGKSAAGHLGDTFSMALGPQPQLSMTKRFTFEGHGMLIQDWPCPGLVHKITMRSNSKLDIDVTDMRISNVSLTVGGTHPIEFYRDGWAVTPFHVEMYNRIAISLNGPSGDLRWVEVDVDFEPVDEAAEAAEIKEPKE